ncbi:hypothetical protein D3C85_871870 [compost metagenome]
MQRVVRRKTLTGVKREPALPAFGLRSCIPGNGQTLQAATGKLHQVLLQRLVAKGVANQEFRRFAIRAFDVDEELLAAAEKLRLHAAILEPRILEIAQHIGRSRLTHCPVVIGILPVPGLLGVATEAAAGGGIAGGVFRQVRRCGLLCMHREVEQQQGA